MLELARTRCGALRIFVQSSLLQASLAIIEPAAHPLTVLDVTSFGNMRRHGVAAASAKPKPVRFTSYLSCHAQSLLVQLASLPISPPSLTNVAMTVVLIRLHLQTSSVRRLPSCQFRVPLHRVSCPRQRY